MSRDFRQIGWDDACREACRDLAPLAIREDLGRQHDWTTLALVPSDAEGRAVVVAREAGIIAGLPAAELFLNECDPRLTFVPFLEDGAEVEPGRQVARIGGSARSLLTSERTMLNFLGRLSGVATLTREYVRAVAGTKARIYDTRKTTPGWRVLEKYAVHVGGGRNHRLNLHEAVLIKDNHLALGANPDTGTGFTPSEAVVRSRAFLADLPDFESADEAAEPECILQVEVDGLDQLDEVLAAGPDLVLLDNMTQDELRQAVRRRDEFAPDIELEASGGVNLDTVAGIACTGVDRISVGGLTHSSRWLDVGLDWLIE